MREKGVKRTVAAMLFMLVTVFVFTVPVQAASAKISKKDAELVVGETLKLKVTGGSGKITWSSKNKKIATVSKDGLVTAKKKGDCTITAKRGSKKLTCKVNVVPLPKGYATVNGKKVKVGSKVKVTYKIQSKKPIAFIYADYQYDRQALKVLSKEKDRFKVWKCVESVPEFYQNGKLYSKYHLSGITPKKPNGFANISCKKAKTFDSMQIKVLKRGNYKINVDLYCINAKFDTIKGYKITTTVK